jgi:hypothetical protein
MNKQANIYNHQHLNKKKNELVENSKNNKSIGSSIYSKNKKLLDKMLRDYQSFCKKYFGESTPIGSMTEERMNKLLEEEQYDKNQPNKINILGNNNNEQFCDIFKDKNENNDIDFENENIFAEISNDLPFSENNRLGLHKNNKNDYKRRILNLTKLKEKEEKKEIEKKEKNEEIEKIKKDEINNLKLMEKNKKNKEKDYNLNYYDFSKKPKKKHIYENIIKQTKYDYEKFPTYLRYDILKGKKIKIDKNNLNSDVKEDENLMILNQEKKHIISNLNISEKIFYNKYKHREKNIFDEFKPYQTFGL